MQYQLWDTELGNLLSFASSCEEALTIVRRILATDGRAAISAWELIAVSDAEQADSLAFGDDLAALASSRSSEAV